VARRGRGEGSAWERVDGRWVVQVSYRGQDGRRKYLTRVLANERLANLMLQGLRARVGADRSLGDTSAPLDHFLADWLERAAPSVSAATLVSYRGHVERHISPLLGGIPVLDLRASDVDRLVRAKLAEGLSPATVERIMTTLAMAVEQAVREGALPRNVVRLARRPKVDRTSHVKAMSPDEATTLLELVAGHEHEALYVLLLGSGIRLGEATGLDWRDIDLERGSVAVRAGKTPNARRLVKIAPFAVDALRRHLAASTLIGPMEPVFRGSRKGQRLRPDTAYAAWRKLLAEAGHLPLRLHDLRHAHATLLLARGTPMRLIAEQLGHANPALTARVYAHVLDAQLEEAVTGLGDLVRRDRLSG